MRFNSKFGKGRLKPGELNGTEAKYEATLKAQLERGEILWYRFEGLKLKLADLTTYSPDFVVMTADGTIECHEVKAGKIVAGKPKPFFQDQAGNVKVKVANEQFPFVFKIAALMPKKDGGGFVLFDV